MKSKILALSKNEEFKKLLKQKKISNKYATIHYGFLEGKSNNMLNISFVMKKNIGNAVTRNKIKRKLKYAGQKILRENKLIDLNYTYVIFGKNNVYKDKFSLVLNEVNETFKKISKWEAKHEIN